ncbi:MAG: hypothetical protein QOG54_772 [Actinomycetota bacterium]|jgi:hypothetical protein|nr:hypothetical protein [Actinomycetota bacterium]
MADPRVEQLFRSLDATFSALLTTEETRAADDLALSFRQGLTIPELLARYPASVSVADRAFGPATFVGEDYLECGASRSIIPLNRGVIKIRPDGEPAIPSEETLLQRLRRAVRQARSAPVSVGAWDSTVEGYLSAAAPDHIEISRLESRVLVPLALVEWVRLGRAG